MAKKKSELSASTPEFAVGKIVGCHGLKGQVKVRPETNSPELLLDLTRVELRHKGGIDHLMLEVAGVELDKRMLFFSFDGRSTRNDVEQLVGGELFAYACEVSELSTEEFWVRDLVGIDVFTTDGAAVGRVADVISGAGDLLEISPCGETSGKTILVPFIKELVPVVDLPGRRIEVMNVPGLLEAQ